MHVTTEETQAICNGDVWGDAAVRSRRAADLFTGLPVAQAALEFASIRHAGQYREIDRAPFIAHPIEVGRLLKYNGQRDEVIAAGLLHDVLEKTETTGPELRHRFGSRIAGLVQSVSGDPAIVDDEQRKRQLRDRVANGESDTIAIFAADKLSKVRELGLLPPWRLDETAIRVKLNHYEASLEMLRRAAPYLALVDQLHAELSRLVAPAVTGAHTARAL
jgi:(p)ppGpp synthase/HD superfamily hydrolase